MAGNRNKRSCVDVGAWEWYNPNIQYQRHVKVCTVYSVSKCHLQKCRWHFFYFPAIIIGTGSVPARGRCFCVESGTRRKQMKGDKNMVKACCDSYHTQFSEFPDLLRYHARIRAQKIFPQLCHL